MTLEPFKEFFDDFDDELIDESDAINIVRYCMDDSKNSWHPIANRPPESGRYILYLSDDQGVSFTWVGKYSRVSDTWDARIPFRVSFDMWRYFPEQPRGHKDGLFVFDDITGTIGGTLEGIKA